MIALAENVIRLVSTFEKNLYFSAMEQAHSQIPNSTFKTYDGAFHNLCEELPETVEEYYNDLQEFIFKILQSKEVTDNLSVNSE